MITSAELEAFLWQYGTKQLIANIESTIYKGGTFFEGLNPPKSLLKEADVETIIYQGSKIYSVAKKGITTTATIYYLHGGGFTCGLSKIQWDMIAYLADNLPYRIVVPDYPLVPHVSYKEIYHFIFEVYKNLSTTKENLFVLGDSAGASLVLGLSQLIDREQVRKPQEQIVISPWLEIELRNETIDIIEPIDPTLDRKGLKFIEKLYADDQPHNPLVSPIYGDYSEAAPISLFIGTKDILYPDCYLFNQICKEKGVALSYYEYKDMIHIFPFFDTPEGNEAKQTILDILR